MQRILLVEEDRDVGELFTTALTGLGGYEVISAEHGDAALLLLERRPDLALVDVRIPGAHGIDIGERALALGVPVVLMTGDFATSRQLDANDVPHLFKPFRVTDLFVAVRQELARSEENCRLLQHSLARLGATQDALALAHQDARETIETVRRERIERKAKEEAARKTPAKGHEDC